MIHGIVSFIPLAGLRPTAQGRTVRDVKQQIESWFPAGSLRYTGADPRDGILVRDYRNEPYGWITAD